MKYINYFLLVVCWIYSDSVAAQKGDLAHFSFPLSPETQVQPSTPELTVESNEYSLDISGSQLQKGVDLTLTQRQVLVLISSSHTRSRFDLDQGKLSIAPVNQPAQSVIKSRISKQQLAQTGLMDNAVALVLDNPQHQHKLQLSTTQPLDEKAIYKVTVKEKQSPFRLALTANQSVSAQRSQVSAQFYKGNKAINMEVNAASLVSPSGESFPVTVSQNGVLHFDTPKDIKGPIAGLYEVRVKSTAQDNSHQIKRDGKIALALSRPSAKIQSVTLNDINRVTADVEILALESSRYEIRALLFGTDDSGQLLPIMETHSAKTVNAGRESIPLLFDRKLLLKSGLRAPFKVKSVRLYDQGQLGLVDQKG